MTSVDAHPGRGLEVAAEAAETDRLPPFAQPRIEKTFLGGAQGALEALESLRTDVEKREGRSPVAAALRHCFAHRLAVPEWLQAAFLAVCEDLRTAKAKTWDDALGRYWPERTKFADVRRELELEELIPAAVWEQLVANPSRAVDRDFFEEIGERSSIALAGSTVERRYYRLVREGRAINLVALREAGAWPLNPHQTPCQVRMEIAT